MTTSPTFLTDALAQIVGADYLAWVASWSRKPYDPRDDMDEDSLRRSRIAPVRSDTYRRAADMPREPWRDELAVAVGDWIPERSA